MSCYKYKSARFTVGDRRSLEKKKFKESGRQNLAYRKDRPDVVSRGFPKCICLAPYSGSTTVTPCAYTCG